jgi:hypothetical protein
MSPELHEFSQMKVRVIRDSFLSGFSTQIEQIYGIFTDFFCFSNVKTKKICENLVESVPSVMKIPFNPNSAPS